MQINIGKGDKNTIINLIPISFHKKEKNAIKQGNEILREEIKNERILLKDSKNNDKEILSNTDLAIIDKFINDEELDLNEIGKKVQKTQKIILDSKNNPVFDFKMMLQKSKEEIKNNEVKTIVTEEDYIPNLSNINLKVPIEITNKSLTYEEVIKNYVIGKSFYLTHIDGLTFEFLYNIAKELQDSNKLNIVLAYTIKDGKEITTPIIIKDGGKPYAIGFIEGRIQDNEYLLRLHLVDFPTKKIVEESKLKNIESKEKEKDKSEIEPEPQITLKLCFEGGI